MLDTIRDLTGRQLGLNPAEIAPDTPFLDLGADSLLMVNMIAELDSRHGVRIAMRELFAADSAADTPLRLAQLVATRMDADRRSTAEPTPAGPAPTAPTPAAPTPPAAVPPSTRHESTYGDVGADQPAANVDLRRTERRAVAPSDATRDVINQQLELMSRFSDLMATQLAVLSTAPTTPPSAVSSTPAGFSHDRSPVVSSSRTPADVRSGMADFSVYFFGDYPEQDQGDKYAIVLEASRFADEHGFHAVWLPERHFHSFGGVFPNPSVLAAALAMQTRRIRLHAGSVVLPLHHPIRVAEEWSVIDNLSGGRVGLCVASGWHANDFAFCPENFGPHKEIMYSHLDTVRALWRGDAVPARSGSGEDIEVRLYPKPIQEMPPLFTAIVGNPESYRQAARHGLGVVTNLMTQSVDALAENLTTYRQTRAECGLDPDAGRVVVLLHSYLGDDVDTARAEAFDPFCRYLRSSLSLFGGVTNSLGFTIDLDNTPDDDVAFMLEQAYARYCESRALIGTVDTCTPIVDRLLAIGVHEVACFVDFGVSLDQVRGSLVHLDALRQRYADRPRPARAAGEDRATTEDPDTAPMSFAQQRLWILDTMFPGRPMYNEPRAIRLDGPLDVDALRAALDQLVAAHPGLRTVFYEVDGEPRQRVVPHHGLDCQLTEHASEDEAAVVREVMSEESRRRFDLANGPLFCARLLRFSDVRHVLVLSVHHIVSDGLSWLVIFRDLRECYRSWRTGRPAALPEPAMSYLDYARAQRAARTPAKIERDLAFWRAKFGDEAPVLTLPTDRPRPAVMGGDGASFFVHLDRELTAALRRFSRDRRVTLFMTLLGGYAAMLSRFSGQDSVVVGAAVANRPPGADDLVGILVDTLPLPIDAAGDPSFGDLLDRIRLATAEAFDHQSVPFDELVRAINPERDAGRNPIFQVMVEYENEAAVGFELPELAATLLEVAADKAAFDLTFYLSNLPDTIQCHVEYNVELFDEGTVRRFLSYFTHILEAAPAAPDTPLSRLGGLTDEDTAALARWQGERRPVSDRCLHTGFCERAADRPDTVAIVDEHGELSYAALNQRANLLAWRLIELGAGQDDLVGICLPAGRDLIIAMLAVLKAGAGYLPLDPTVAEQRLTYMLADSRAALLITPHGIQLAERGFDDPESALSPLNAVGGRCDDPPSRATADGLAYCIYTSGSTGRPKGVGVPHQGPVNLIDWYVDAHPPKRTLQWTSCGFDVSVPEIFATLTGGGTLVLIPEAMRYDPRATADWVARHRVQRLGMPFTPLKYLAEALDEAFHAPSLEEIISCGEKVVLTQAVRRFLARHPNCRLYNEYGPTETSVIVTSHVVDPDGPDAPPIGRPVPNVRAHLLGADGRPVPVGAVGEIHLAGAALARGYLNRSAETAAAFVPDPFEPGSRMYRTGDLGRWRNDGTLEFLGRVDDQVKIRGYRVEPGEVERLLCELDSVRDAAVVAQRDQGDEPYLAAYVVATEASPGNGATPPARREQLVSQLGAMLPDYMVPRSWVFLPDLPLNPSGKLDRRRLPAPQFDAPADSGEPATELERALHDMWCDQLGVPLVGVETTFFEVGGHSLNAIRFLNRVRDAYGVDVPVLAFFQAPTIRAMAAYLQSRVGPARTRGSV